MTLPTPIVTSGDKIIVSKELDRVNFNAVDRNEQMRLVIEALKQCEVIK